MDDLEIQAGSVGYATMAVKSISLGEKAANGKNPDPGRFFSGYLNAKTLDRENEIYEPEGIDYRAFKNAGGPILARHYGETTAEGYSCVVARVLSIQARKDGLFISKAEFDTDPLSEHYRGKVARGFIKCMSAGLLRREVESRDVKGKRIWVVTKAELIHGILTAQPMNRESLITGVKSWDRLVALEKRFDELKTAAVSSERFDELAGSIERISGTLEELSVSLKSVHTPKPTEQRELDRLASSMADLAKQAARIAKG